MSGVGSCTWLLDGVVKGLCVGAIFMGVIWLGLFFKVVGRVRVAFLSGV